MSDDFTSGSFIEIGGLRIPDDGRPIAVEICSGSGNLSRHLKAAGFHVVPIDWSKNRHSPLVATAEVDLSSEEGLAELLAFLDHPSIALVFMAPKTKAA